MISASKSYCYLRISVCALMVMMCCSAGAQTDTSLFRIQDYCNQKRFDEAIKAIDKAITKPGIRQDPFAWHLRSFAYLQSYKMKVSSSAPYNMKYVSYLDSSVASAIRGDRLDASNEYKENNKNFITFSNRTFYKLCSTYLQDSLNYQKSLAYYQKYKSTIVLVDSSFKVKEKDIEYYTAAGSIFSNLYTNSNFDPRFGDVAISALQRVLELDPKNIKANLNLGVIYYNKGATLMRQMDYDIDLNQLDVYQENARKLFKQSLPFMTQVYELDPKDQRALEGLQGIYYSLNEFDKSNEFKQKLEKVQHQK